MEEVVPAIGATETLRSKRMSEDSQRLERRYTGRWYRMWNMD